MAHYRPRQLPVAPLPSLPADAAPQRATHFSCQGVLWATNRWPEVRDLAICPISGIGTTSPKAISPRTSPADPLSRQCLYIPCAPRHSCLTALATPQLTLPTPTEPCETDPTSSTEHPISHPRLDSQTSSHITTMVYPSCLPQLPTHRPTNTSNNRRKHPSKGGPTSSSPRTTSRAWASPRTRSRSGPRTRRSRPSRPSGSVRAPSSGLALTPSIHAHWLTLTTPSPPRLRRLRRSHLRGPLAHLLPVIRPHKQHPARGEQQREDIHTKHTQSVVQ